MGNNLLNQKYLNDELAAQDFLIKFRWPNGIITCAHCQAEGAYRLQVKNVKRIVLKCRKCRKQFSATVGTIFEDSHIPLNKWFMAMHLMCSSKKGMSAHQLHRMLGVTYKSAWFMAHRIRHGLTQWANVAPLGGIVECDETYIGGREEGRGMTANKVPVFALVQRGGAVRSMVMPRVTAKNLQAAVRTNVERSAKIMTDSYIGYKGLDKDYAHESVNHAEKEYVRGNVHTNTVEGYFSLLKRGIIGTYHHVSEKHLHRYLAEFDFRYNARKDSDEVRTFAAMSGVEGKRLQYQK
jgi:transposase-like protein